MIILPVLNVIKTTLIKDMPFVRFMTGNWYDCMQYACIYINIKTFLRSFVIQQPEIQLQRRKKVSQVSNFLNIRFFNTHFSFKWKMCFYLLSLSGVYMYRFENINDAINFLNLFSMLWSFLHPNYIKCSWSLPAV